MVLVLIGIIAGFMVLSIGDGGKSAKLQEDSRRLAALIDMAGEDAVLQTVEYGVQLRKGGYRFFVSKEPGEWLPASDKLYRERSLPETVQLTLTIENLPVVLNEEWDDAMTKEGEKQQYKPQIILFSSGERSPFEIQVGTEDEPPSYRVNGDLIGSVRTERIMEDL